MIVQTVLMSRITVMNQIILMTIQTMTTALIITMTQIITMSQIITMTHPRNNVRTTPVTFHPTRRETYHPQSSTYSL